jgi:hypothetical protein
MMSHTTKPDSSQPTAEMAVDLFDNWFDPIEAAVRARARELNDGLIAFADGKMITMKVPYPTGFYAKGLDGRIDDPKIGWKSRGLWTSSGDRVPWHQEGGLGMTRWR